MQNTGSISSVVGMSAQGAYAASKGAVSQLTRQMAKDYSADGIRSNAVCPGSVATAVLDKYERRTPLPKARFKSIDRMIDGLPRLPQLLSSYGPI